MVKGKQDLILGIVAATNLALGYMGLSVRDSLTERIEKIENSTFESNNQQDEQSSVNERKMAKVFSELDAIKEGLGMTSAELKRAREAAQNLRKQQDAAAKDAKEMSSRLAEKASSSDIDGLRQETTTRLAAAQQDSNTRIGDVYGEVTGLKRDLAATRDDWGRQLVDVKNVLSERIAKNSTELAELRKKGERDYFEFDIRKNSKRAFSHVADIQLGLMKTDPKKHKYNIAIEVDDQRL